MTMKLSLGIPKCVSGDLVASLELAISPSTLSPTLNLPIDCRRHDPMLFAQSFPDRARLATELGRDNER